ncbi:MAG TPA: hypothetical protein VFR05_08180, partial [Terriglobia bacterium]|nr:hypothetical protein [Terriglobia bacterium]
MHGNGTVYFLSSGPRTRDGEDPRRDILALDLVSGNHRSVWTAPPGVAPASIALSPDGTKLA